MDVIRQLFPASEHQLCLLHLGRNLRRGLSREGREGASKQAQDLPRRIRGARDREEARPHLIELGRVVEREKPGWARRLQEKAEHSLAFLGYPQDVRRHIYTTNVVESLNAGIEQMRLELGGYFPSQDCLEVNLFIQVVNRQDRWWNKPVPAVRAHSYVLRQLFALRYELDEEGVNVLLPTQRRAMRGLCRRHRARARGLQP